MGGFLLKYANGNLARLEQLVMHYFRHSFNNFKNIANSSINLYSPSLTILIGKNGSGKTNVIEGIKVLTNLVKGVPLNKFTDINKGGDCEVRGGLSNCIGFHRKNFQLSRRDLVEVSSEKPLLPLFNYSITVSKNGGHRIYISQEKLNVYLDRDINIFTATAAKNGESLSVSVDNKKYPEIFTADCSVLQHSKRLAISLKEGTADVITALNALEESMATTPYIFVPDPQTMRLYEPIKSGDILSPNGSNLSAVLYLLNRNKSAIKRINQAIHHLPEESFGDIGFVKTSINDVLFGFYTDDKRKKLLDARLLSDGTLRMLAILAALESVPKESQIIIEEFDNGLHPSRANLLIDYFEKTVKRRKLRILITTHNPAFMNALNDKQMERVILCHRDHTNGHSKLTKYADFPDIDILKMQGNLGNLVTRDTIERRMSPDFEKKRSARFKKWMDEIQA